MRGRRDREVLWLLAWVLGLLLLAGFSGGVGAFLFGAWTTVGIVAVVSRYGGGLTTGEVLAAVGVALAAVGLLWWWATDPSSLLAGAAGYLGPVFLGGTVGAVLGVGVMQR